MGGLSARTTTGKDKMVFGNKKTEQFDFESDLTRYKEDLIPSFFVPQKEALVQRDYFLNLKIKINDLLHENIFLRRIKEDFENEVRDSRSKFSVLNRKHNRLQFNLQNLSSLHEKERNELKLLRNKKGVFEEKINSEFSSKKKELENQHLLDVDKLQNEINELNEKINSQKESIGELKKAIETLTRGYKEIKQSRDSLEEQFKEFIRDNHLPNVNIEKSLDHFLDVFVDKVNNSGRVKREPKTEEEEPEEEPNITLEEYRESEVCVCKNKKKYYSLYCKDCSRKVDRLRKRGMTTEEAQRDLGIPIDNSDDADGVPTEEDLENEDINN